MDMPALALRRLCPVNAAYPQPWLYLRKINHFYLFYK